MNSKLGLIYAIAAYIFWGIVPIFWKQIAHIDSVEIVMHRMVWSCVLVTLLIIVSRQWLEYKTLFSKPQVLLRLSVASVLISINWGVYIWAINADRIVEASLGYFLNPLINVALGVLIFNETLRRGQLIALSVAAVGVLYLLTAYGAFPWIAFVLAITFSLYGVVKKSIGVPATHGMGIETMFIFIPALIYLSNLELQGNGQFLASKSNAIMLVLGGLFTLIPLVLFAAAAKRITMTALGMTQYIGPTLQLLLGVFLYAEPFGSQRMIAFGLIWLALAIYSADQLKQRSRRQSMKAG